MRIRRIRKVVWIVAIALGAGAAAAQEAGKPGPGTPSAEQRSAMAEIHQGMADCLRSESPIDACRAQMQSRCRAMMGAEGCPMMMGRGHGMMGGGGGMMGGGAMGGPMGGPMAPGAPKPPDAGP